MVEDQKLLVYVPQHLKDLESIGQGSFGKVYRAFDTKREKHVALKIELRRATKVKQTPLLREGTILKALTRRRKTGFPRFYGFYKTKYTHLMEMELVGESLHKKFRLCSKQFGLLTTVEVARQSLKRIEQLHSCNYIHRDIKPANLTTGRSRRSTTIYLLDFGLAKQYCDRKTKVHLPPNQDHNFVGTRVYASVNVDLKLAPSRRDDLESWFYCVVEWLTGDLPWFYCSGGKKSLAQDKQNTTPRELLHNSPAQFYKMQQYIRSLTYEQKPDYDFIYYLLNQVVEESGSTFSVFDWQVQPKRAEHPGQLASQSTVQIDAILGSFVQPSDFNSGQAPITEMEMSSQNRSLMCQKTIHLGSHDIHSFREDEEYEPPQDPPVKKQVSFSGPQENESAITSDLFAPIRVSAQVDLETLEVHTPVEINTETVQLPFDPPKENLMRLCTEEFNALERDKEEIITTAEESNNCEIF